MIGQEVSDGQPRAAIQCGIVKEAHIAICEYVWLDIQYSKYDTTLCVHQTDKISAMSQCPNDPSALNDETTLE